MDSVVPKRENVKVDVQRESIWSSSVKKRQEIQSLRRGHHTLSEERGLGSSRVLNQIRETWCFRTKRPKVDLVPRGDTREYST